MQTVRLFHPSRPDHCLAIFAHPDTPTSIAFHPKDDRFFASGCLDHKMRVWSIVEKSVRHVGEVAEVSLDLFSFLVRL
jgi:WD40 repeat protein